MRLTKLALLSFLPLLPLLVACNADVEPVTTAPVSEAPATSTEATPAPVVEGKTTTPSGSPGTPGAAVGLPSANAPTKVDITDVSAAAICATPTNATPFGSFRADSAWEIDDAIDATATVVAGTTMAGMTYNDLSLAFVYPTIMTDTPEGSVPTVAVGHWSVSVAAPKEGVDALVAGATVDVAIRKMGKLTRRCTNEPGGGGLSFEGAGDAGKLVVTARTETLIEGTLERRLADGTVSNLSFRAPIVAIAPTGDTVCCMF